MKIQNADQPFKRINDLANDIDDNIITNPQNGNCLTKDKRPSLGGC